MASGSATTNATTRQHRVVGEHHDRHDHHQRRVAHPRHPTPLEELRERLDVARHPGDETTTAFVAVVGQAELVDVADQSLAQVVQRPFAALAEPDGGLPERDAGDEHGDEADRRQSSDQRDVDRIARRRHR